MILSRSSAQEYDTITSITSGNARVVMWMILIIIRPQTKCLRSWKEVKQLVLVSPPFSYPITVRSPTQFCPRSACSIQHLDIYRIGETRSCSQNRPFISSLWDYLMSPLSVCREHRCKSELFAMPSCSKIHPSQGELILLLLEFKFVC